MAKALKHRSGIEMLSQRYRTIFRIPENINHYSKEDYPVVERKFLKYALLVGAATSNFEPQSDTPCR